MAKLQYGMKITFIFILILFIDSVNRVYRVQMELASLTESKNPNVYVSCKALASLYLALRSTGGKSHQPHVNLNLSELNSAAAMMGHERIEVQARKFYSQRNMYLCGFTLFLSLILNRTYTMILEILRLEERLKVLESSKKSAAATTATSSAEVSALKAEIKGLQTDGERKDKQVLAMKAQAEGLHREYDALADKYAQAIGDTGYGKKDE